MEKFLVFIFSVFLVLTDAEVDGNVNDRHQNVKLFVFGDSYADTGNTRKPDSSAWKQPYGRTFPGKPSGRFSDGRVLTDFIASYMGVRTPMAHNLVPLVTKSRTKKGVNFAQGGTGVFRTIYGGPNMTTQINYFYQLLLSYNFTKFDLDSSIALVSLAGNDYSTFIATGGTKREVKSFIRSIINQLVINIKRIHQLGVPKIGVTAIEPLGCLPQATVDSSYSNCTQTFNYVARFHNHILSHAVRKLNHKFRSRVFVILDLYSAFSSSLKKLQQSSGQTKIGNPLKPCCIGVSSEYSCGSVEQNGTKRYVVCQNPKLSFFWDDDHPTQNGWRLVYHSLRPSLQQLYPCKKHV